MPHNKSSSGLGLYDTACCSKFKEYLPGRVEYAAPDEALIERFRVATSEEKEAGLSFPIMTVWRTGESLAFETNYNDSLTKKGRKLAYEPGNLTTLKSIPITLTYQFDLWSITKETLDELYREFVFCITLDPDITIELTPEVKERFTLVYEEEEDNTDISTFQETQRLYRKTLRYTVRAQMFMRYDKNVPTDIDIKVEI